MLHPESERAEELQRANHLILLKHSNKSTKLVSSEHSDWCLLECCLPTVYLTLFNSPTAAELQRHIAAI